MIATETKRTVNGAIEDLDVIVVGARNSPASISWTGYAGWA